MRAIIPRWTGTTASPAMWRPPRTGGTSMSDRRWTDMRARGTGPAGAGRRTGAHRQSGGPGSAVARAALGAGRRRADQGRQSCSKARWTKWTAIARRKNSSPCCELLLLHLSRRASSCSSSACRCRTCCALPLLGRARALQDGACATIRSGRDCKRIRREIDSGFDALRDGVRANAAGGGNMKRTEYRTRSAARGGLLFMRDVPGVALGDRVQVRDHAGRIAQRPGDPHLQRTGADPGVRRHRRSRSGTHLGTLSRSAVRNAAVAGNARAHVQRRRPAARRPPAAGLGPASATSTARR